MKMRWYRDWYAGFFAAALIIEVITTLYLAGNIGRNMLGVLVDFDPINDKLTVIVQTPALWPGLFDASHPNEQTAFKYQDVLWAKNDPCFQTSKENLEKSILTNSNDELTLQVRRDGLCKTILVKIYPFDTKLFLDLWLPNFITWLGYLGVAIAIFYASPKEPLNRTTALVMGMIAVMFSFDRFWIYQNQDWAYRLLVILSILARSITAAALFRLVLFFPLPIFVKQRETITRIAYGLCALATGGYVFFSLSAMITGHSENALGHLTVSYLGILGVVLVGMRILWAAVQTRDIALRKQMIVILSSILFALPYLLLHAQAVQTQNGLVFVLVLCDLWFVYVMLQSNWLRTMPLVRKVGIASSLALAFFFTFYGISSWLRERLFLGGVDLKYLMLCIPLAFAFVIVRYCFLKPPVKS